MKSFTLLSNLLVGSLFLFAASGQAQIPPWNYKKAEKKVRVIKLQIHDKAGTPIADTQVALKCNGDTVIGVTNRKGEVTFRRQVKQKSECILEFPSKIENTPGKLIRRIKFDSYEPNTVAYLSLESEVYIDGVSPGKSPAPKNQTFKGKREFHQLDVYLYMKGKRLPARVKNIIVTCLTPSGKKIEFQKKSNIWIAKAKFKEIPYGSECFVQVTPKKGNTVLKGLVNFAEADHTNIKKLRLHINIPKGQCGKCKPGKCKPGPGDCGGKCKPYTPPTEDSSDEGDGSDQEETPVIPKNPYFITIQNCETKAALAGKTVHLYDPTSDEPIEAEADENGVITIDESRIVPGKKYLVFLGSPDEPEATRNVFSEVVFGETNQNAVACFDIGPLRYEFRTDKSLLDKDQEDVIRLNKLAAAMKEYPNLKVVVEGHTDSENSASYNLTLSKKRATTIADYLIKQGEFEANRIEIQPYGESQLKYQADGKTEDKKASRRVEVKPYWDRD